MAYSHLSRERLADIKQAFIDAQVLYSADVRALLMTGIHPQFVTSLKNFSTNQMQLAGDLSSLNSVAQLVDGTVPLTTWLENAVDVFTPRIQASIFVKALEEMALVGEPGEPRPAREERVEKLEFRESMVVNTTGGNPQIKPGGKGMGAAARNDIVNLGFAPDSEADQTLPKNRPLRCGESYYFWFNIGYELEESIGSGQALNVENLPSEAHLTVALFAFENELKITTGADIGELRIQRAADPAGQDPQSSRPLLASVKVTRQPVANVKGQPRLSSKAPADILDRFLFFPVLTPETEGTYRLRCNIYCGQVLVQSHLVSARVMREPTEMGDALFAKVDYALSQTLRPAHLAAFEAEPHRLSLMINSNGNGSHNFRFFGSDGAEVFKDDAEIDGPQLQGFLKQAREAMRRVSWGSEEEWDVGRKLSYRYRKEKFDREKLARDLAYLARAGWRIYAGFLPHLKTSAQGLETIMSQSGQVQIALKLSPRAVLPAAVIYDYPWMPEKYTDFATTDFELCPTFAAAIEKAGSAESLLKDCDCFKGGCSLKAQIDEITRTGSILDLPPIICPSGFWGYRHELGLPLTLDGANSETPPVIKFQDVLRTTAGVSTDKNFIERDAHIDRLRTLTPTMALERGDGYRDVLKSLKKLPHLLYFYCHGGIMANSSLPYLEIGSTDYFLPATLLAERISWHDPHPLVFINGCHTTSLNPEITLDFVSSFVQQAGAAGVIGTEITIFEELAVRFAEECLGRFLGAQPFGSGMPIGKAVRGARLELLRRGNPLGLVYIPFAMANLRLEQVSGN